MSTFDRAVKLYLDRSTKSEQTITIIEMLLQGHSASYIRDTLGVSSESVWKVKHIYIKGTDYE